MKQLLEYIIPNIVNHPEDVKIEESENNGVINITIETHPEDIGRVIGKQGKVIKAIRQIVRVLAIKQGVRVNIDVLDSGKEAATPASEEEAAEFEAEIDTELPSEESGIDIE